MAKKKKKSRGKSGGATQGGATTATPAGPEKPRATAPEESRPERTKLAGPERAARPEVRSSGADNKMKSAAKKPSAAERDRQRQTLSLAVPLVLTALGMTVVIVIAMLAAQPIRSPIDPADQQVLDEKAARIAEIDRHEMRTVQRFSDPFFDLEEEKVQLGRERYQVIQQYFPQFPPEWFEYEVHYAIFLRPLFVAIIAFFFFRVATLSVFYYFTASKRELRDVFTGAATLLIGAGLYWVIYLDVYQIFGHRAIEAISG